MAEMTANCDLVTFHLEPTQCCSKSKHAVVFALFHQNLATMAESGTLVLELNEATSYHTEHLWSNFLLIKQGWDFNLAIHSLSTCTYKNLCMTGCQM